MSRFYELSDEAQLNLLTDSAQAALEHWNLSGADLRLLKHRENAVFGVESNGARAALRLHRFAYHSDAELDSELLWMCALSDAGILVPEVIPTTSGSNFISIANEAFPEPLQVDLFQWIDGEQLGSVEEGVADEARLEDTYRAIGEIAARVHNQASSWQLPPGFTRHAWDEEGLAGDSPFWGEFWQLSAATDVERRLLERCRDKLYDDLRQQPKSDRNYSMIHADFAPENLMVDGDGVRLIDFDDAGFGWHLLSWRPRCISYTVSPILTLR